MDTNLNISLIVARSLNNCIGKDGALPWHISSDLQRFAKLTTGHVVIMGRNTWNSIWNQIGKPLPNRHSIVISRTMNSNIIGCFVARSLETALAEAQMASQGEIFVIGGSRIFDQFMFMANKIYLTTVQTEIQGDTFFPEIRQDEWKITQREEVQKNINDDYATVFEILEKEEFVALRHARTDDQRDVMLRIAERQTCPFCLKQLQVEHKKPILKEGRFWLVTENQWPYTEAKRHLLIICKVHAEKLADLPLASGTELLEMLTWVENEYSIPSGGIALRFGTPFLNGGTVNHLHFHVIEPNNPSAEDYEPVRFRIGAKK